MAYRYLKYSVAHSKDFGELLQVEDWQAALVDYDRLLR
jgi:hypothetical protein